MIFNSNKSIILLEVPVIKLCKLLAKIFIEQWAGTKRAVNKKEMYFVVKLTFLYKLIYTFTGTPITYYFLRTQQHSLQI